MSHPSDIEKLAREIYVKTVDTGQFATKTPDHFVKSAFRFAEEFEAEAAERRKVTENGRTKRRTTTA